MRVRGLLGAAAWLAVGLLGCDPPAQVGAGEPCASLNECKPGLSCIEGVCDSDLTSIAGQVPMYADAAVASGTGGTGGTAGAGGTTGAGAAAGATAGTAGADAGAR